jgi:hypothetical protein
MKGARNNVANVFNREKRRAVSSERPDAGGYGDEQNRTSRVTYSRTVPQSKISIWLILFGL